MKIHCLNFYFLASFQSSDIICEEFAELSKLYHVVKKQIIVAEELYDDVPFALMNEVRSSYDHVCRIFLNENFSSGEIKTQFISAKRHLKRAGYDTCELVAGWYVRRIFEMLNVYPPKTLHAVLKEKYSQQKLFLNDIKDTYLAEARSEKNSKLPIEDDFEIETIYPEFQLVIEKIKDSYKYFVKHELLLSEYQRGLDEEQSKKQEEEIKKQAAEIKRQREEIKKQKSREWKLLIIAAIIGLVVSSIFYYLEVFSGMGSRENLEEKNKSSIEILPITNEADSFRQDTTIIK